MHKEDSLALYAFPELDARRISSTNMLERLNMAGSCLPLAFSIQPGQYSNKPVWELACQLCIQIHEGVHVSHGNMTVTCLGIIGFSVNVATFHQIHDISLQ